MLWRALLGGKMPQEKKFIKKVKVKAVSASNPGAEPKKRMSKAEWDRHASELNKVERIKKEEKIARERAKAEALEIEAAKKRVAKQRQVEELVESDGPKVVSGCIARALGIAGGEAMLPKEVLEKAKVIVPDAELGDGLPKEQLLALGAILAERKAQKKALEFEKQKVKDKLKGEESSVLRAEAEERARIKAEQTAAEVEALAEVNKAKAALREPEPEGEGHISMAKKRNSKKGGKVGKEEKLAAEVAAETAAVDAELEAAARRAAASRLDGKATLSAIDCGPFTLPNPGGGANLLEEAAFVLAPGHRYAVVGRNGKGKSTLLRWLAARRVGALPDTLHVHYVSQEVSLTEEQEQQRPAEVVLAADVERTMLLEEAAAAEEDGSTIDQARLVTVHDRLEAIDADAAPARAAALLVNLGFSEELRSRPLKALSGGWRVRVALAVRDPTAWTIIRHDGPGHLGL